MIQSPPPPPPLPPYDNSDAEQGRYRKEKKYHDLLMKQRESELMWGIAMYLPLVALFGIGGFALVFYAVYQGFGFWGLHGFVLFAAAYVLAVLEIRKRL